MRTVHKFGGTSLADADAFQRVCQIVQDDLVKGGTHLIVVSAMGGVTDELMKLSVKAESKDQSYIQDLEKLKKKHLCVAEEFIQLSQKKYEEGLNSDLKDLLDILQGIFVSGQCSESVRELISGYGEIWSAQLLSLCLEGQGVSSSWLDARQVLFVGDGESGPVVDWLRSQKEFDECLQATPDFESLVVTGYIASNSEGKPTTLKRNGSDFSAAIFSKLTKAKELIIWTDVDGVMSADPRRVPQAFVIETLSYDEAMELAFFGAKVIHPKTMAPVISEKIPLWIKNSFRPELPGTCVQEIAKKGPIDSPAKGFACIEKVALINVEGSGMLGVPGVAERLFRSMKEAGISVVMISQASSEHSICFVVPEAESTKAQREIRKTFFFEFDHKQIQNVDVINGCAVMAVVGDLMAQTPGVSATFFSALARAGINVRAIAQGSSERNISVVIDGQQATKALRAVHAGFYLSKLTLSMAVIGPGLIGETFLKQIEEQCLELSEKENIDLRVRAIADSKKMIFLESQEELKSWSDLLNGGKPTDLNQLTNQIVGGEFPHSVVVDCTASEAISENYEKWLERGIHIVTPNKKAGSGSLAAYKKLRTLSGEYRSHFFYETTVGAGLPVISTLQDLLATGDRVLRIEGVLSGTLAYIFDQLSSGGSFSEIVLDAKKNGFTEPDPRDDLSGMDVARKVVILARELGHPVSVQDVEVQSLVPEELRSLQDTKEFLERLSEFDEEMKERLRKAVERGHVLRYVGEVDQQGQCRVGLKEYASDHSFARLRGSDNIISFTTSRYRQQPLIVQGPGAGPEVTAAGVFSDVLRLSHFLGGGRVRSDL